MTFSVRTWRCAPPPAPVSSVHERVTLMASALRGTGASVVLGAQLTADGTALRLTRSRARPHWRAADIEARREAPKTPPTRTDAP